MRQIPLVILAAVFSAASLITAWAAESFQTKQADVRVETIATGLEHPWSLAFLPDGSALVTERAGRLRHLRDGRLSPPIAGVPEVWVSGQGGLLEVALHPRFAENRFVYLSYAAGGLLDGTGTELARGRLSADMARLEDVETIFVAEPKSFGGVHFGGRIVFTGDDTLLLTLGDRGKMEQAQDRSTHFGGVMRLKDDGSAAPDNPFAGAAGVRAEVYTWGNRNPQGMARRPGTDQVWAHEHGPRGGDEVNILKPGANYGWPKTTHGINYSGTTITDQKTAPGVEPSVVVWVPSIAPSGMAFYDGDLFPAWQGDLFVGALAQEHLRRLELDGDRVVDQEVIFSGERIRDVRAGPDGALWLLTDARDGKVLRLVPDQ